jgi:prepilin-type N-terminal cleavage/methylation domain-containing protein
LLIVEKRISEELIMIRSLKKQEGFTLIEVMAGMIILSLGLLLLLPMMVTSMQANDFARGSTEASMLIKDKMEELKNTYPPTSGVDSVGTVQRTWTATSISYNLWRLDVTIGWTDRNDRAHSNTVTSYMSRR